MNTELSRHAEARIRQRGMREDDVAVIIDAGTTIDGESVLLLDRDVDREVMRRKHEIAILERLRGCRVVMAKERTVVTVYRPGRKTEHRLLRGLHRHHRPGEVAAGCAPTAEPAMGVVW